MTFYAERCIFICSKYYCFMFGMKGMRSVKKVYEKPALLCEELHPEEMLCGCEVRNPTYNEVAMCIYEYKPFQFGTFVHKLFASNWEHCDDVDHVYCYHMGQVTLFSS